MSLIANPAGNYHFLAAPGKPYSTGIIADPGYELVHLIFERFLPLESALAVISEHLNKLDRSPSAIAGLELRIPAPLTDYGFDSFNRHYVSSLRAKAVAVGDLTPTARTNVAPLLQAPNQPSVAAVTYTVPSPNTNYPGFVMSGTAEQDCPTEVGAIASIFSLLSTEMSRLGISWDLVTHLQFYGTRVPPELYDSVQRLGAVGGRGIHWLPSNPPLQYLRYEADVRCSAKELTFAL